MPPRSTRGGSAIRPPAFPFDPLPLSLILHDFVSTVLEDEHGAPPGGSLTTSSPPAEANDVELGSPLSVNDLSGGRVGFWTVLAAAFAAVALLLLNRQPKKKLSRVMDTEQNP